MKACRWAALMMAAMIATAGLPAAGEASDVLARTFLERAGVAPDAATLARTEAFLEAEAIDSDVLDMIPEDRLRAYGAHLRDVAEGALAPDTRFEG